MNWHAQTKQIASGEDPLLIGGRNVRLPRLDLIAGMALALIVSVVSGLNGFVGVTPADADAPARETSMAQRDASDTIEPAFADATLTPIVMDAADADFTFELSELRHWTTTDSAVGPAFGFDRPMNGMFRSLERPTPPLTCAPIDGATFN